LHGLHIPRNGLMPLAPVSWTQATGGACADWPFANGIRSTVDGTKVESQHARRLLDGRMEAVPRLTAAPAVATAMVLGSGLGRHRQVHDDAQLLRPAERLGIERQANALAAAGVSVTLRHLVAGRFPQGELQRAYDEEMAP
jgi:hypothetical protein